MFIWFGARTIKGYKERFSFKNNLSMITIIVTSLAVCNFNNLLFYILWVFPIFVLLNINEEEKDEPIKKEKKVLNKEKLRIGIDARGLDGNKAGIPTYIEEIIKEINKQDSKNEYILYSSRKINLDVKLNDNITIKDGEMRLRKFLAIL